MELGLIGRALPDITSGPEVCQIFKIRTVRKPDVFLTGRRTFNTFKNRRKNPKNPKKILNPFIIFFCLFIWSRNFWHQVSVQEPYLIRIDNPYLVGKMFKNISPDSVRSGRTCLVRKLICLVRLSLTVTEGFFMEQAMVLTLP